MITTAKIREFQPRVFSLMLEPCSAMVLPHVLNPDIPFVWLANHMPNLYLEWWRADVPLRKNGVHHSIEIRSISFELQLPTKDFLALLSEFKDSGMSRYKILAQDGLYLEFYLPHAREYASVVSPRIFF